MFGVSMEEVQGQILLAHFALLMCVCVFNHVEEIHCTSDGVMTVIFISLVLFIHCIQTKRDHRPCQVRRDQVRLPFSP